jgi:hypothetical protein
VVELLPSRRQALDLVPSTTKGEVGNETAYSISLVLSLFPTHPLFPLCDAFHYVIMQQGPCHVPVLDIRLSTLQKREKETLFVYKLSNLSLSFLAAAKEIKRALEVSLPHCLFTSS